MSEVFLSTDARRACPHSVIGSTVGAYPRGTGLNPVKGNGHSFPSYRLPYLSSFSDTLTHMYKQAYISLKKEAYTEFCKDEGKSVTMMVSLNRTFLQSSLGKKNYICGVEQVEHYVQGKRQWWRQTFRPWGFISIEKPQGQNVRLHHCLFPCTNNSPIKLTRIL